MKLKIRNEKGEMFVLDNLSKAMEIKEFKKKVFTATQVEPKFQRLLFAGKILHDHNDLCDFKLQHGNIVQLLERKPLSPLDNEVKDKKDDEAKAKPVEEPAPSSSEPESSDAAAKENLERLKELCPDLAAEVAKEAEEQAQQPCKKCKGVETRPCKECGCFECGGKDSPDTQLFCEECEYTTHMHCLDPPLEQIPEDDWYCPYCKNDASQIVQAGEMVRYGKTRAKMPSRMQKSKRDWGRGYATAGTTKTCSKVPTNHFGPIPGIEVGMNWKLRIQCSEEGVHRPPVAGIAGRANEGCYSLVLSGGYEDDVDDGDEFIYTGSGGRDLSGNKRTAEQSSDQTLTKQNRAIAANCDAKIDEKDGGEAKNWKKGRPVRVLRSYKLAKHSKFAPAEGVRYDGLYKVVKYYPEKGKSGFIVWRYVLRRDDPAPAPWEKGAKKFKCIVPAEYVDKSKEAKDIFAKAKGGKRKLSDANGNDEEAKKAKKDDEEEEYDNYEVDDEITNAVKADVRNKKMWDECLEFKAETKLKWLEKVEELFGCVVCCDILFQPITTECGHNVCRDCMKRSFKANVTTCSQCRNELGKDYNLSNVNEECSKALLVMFPGYDAGRK